ncbi:MAG: AraC family transcriptional regulator [Kofleriaceae bacterium]
MKPTTKAFYEDAVRRAVDRIAKSLDEALDLQDLARLAALSPLHFHHVFRGMVGETPLEMHRRLRLERAAQELEGDRAITQLAFDAGYETHEAFTRAFRKAYAHSPSEFRSRRIGRIEIPTKNGVHWRHVNLIFQGDTNMDATIETMPEMLVATVRHIGPYNQINQAFGKLDAIAGPAGLFAVPGVKIVAIYYDDPQTTPAAELRSDAGLAIPAGTNVPAGLGTEKLAAGRYAKTLHRGPYTTIGDTWSQLMGGWIPQHDLRIANNVSFELYLNTPMNTKPEDLLTEIYVPVSQT